MTILESVFCRYAAGVPIHRVTIQVDTANDVPTPDANWAPGSICIIAADHSYKRLNEQGEWA